MNTVSPAEVAATAAELSPCVQEALGDLVGAAKEGLLALSVGVGLGVLETLMAEEVQELCGPRGVTSFALTWHLRDTWSDTLAQVSCSPRFRPALSAKLV